MPDHDEAAVLQAVAGVFDEVEPVKKIRFANEICKRLFDCCRDPIVKNGIEFALSPRRNTKHSKDRQMAALDAYSGTDATTLDIARWLREHPPQEATTLATILSVRPSISINAPGVAGLVALSLDTSKHNAASCMQHRVASLLLHLFEIECPLAERQRKGQTAQHIALLLSRLYDEPRFSEDYICRHIAGMLDLGSWLAVFDDEFGPGAALLLGLDFKDRKWTNIARKSTSRFHVLVAKFKKTGLTDAVKNYGRDLRQMLVDSQLPGLIAASSFDPIQVTSIPTEYRLDSPVAAQSLQMGYGNEPTGQMGVQDFSFDAMIASDFEVPGTSFFSQQNHHST